MTRSPVGIFPPEARETRSRLFNALEQAFTIRFEARRPGEWGDLAAAVVFASQESACDAPCPALLIAGGDDIADTPLRVRFSSEAAVDRRLRGQVLEEKSGSHVGRLPPEPGDVVLATAAEMPVWLLRRSNRHERFIVSTSPDELLETEGLRDHLRSGRFLGLLPLVHFLRQVTAKAAWVEPPLRAAFIVDDPNLRSTSYGYVRFSELIQNAIRNGYHVVLASVPLDYGFAHPRTTGIFREHASLVSMAIHGNNHEHLELLRADSGPRARAIAAQALRRTAAFEKRAGLPVARVMCPPHEVCSEPMLDALFRLGFEGVTTARLLRAAKGKASPARLLAEWDPAQFVAGGLPILGRRTFARPLDDIVLRAYLNQPLLLFGHHHDLADGFARLETAAARVNALGSVHWGSLTDICRTNFATRRETSTLRIRLYARRIAVDIPADVDQLTVEIPSVASTNGPMMLACDAMTAPVWPSEVEPTRISFQGPFASTVQLQLLPGEPLQPEAIAPPGWQLWPIVRRGLAEGRDRMTPLRSRLARRRT
jgi:hypothetical protein